MSTEFDVIERFFKARAAARQHVLLGIGDDAAVTTLPDGCELVTATDALVEGTHFLAGASPNSVGHRCLAVNLSDMAAMGAEPLWASLALGMPAADSAWLGGFADGFFALADRFGVSLIGGDTVRANLFASVTVQGAVPVGQAVKRSGAGAGDLIYVTGSLGDSAAGRLIGQGELAVKSDMPAGAHVEVLSDRFCFPTPRLQSGIDVREFATAMIDISDGFAVDLGRMLAASGVGAEISIENMPLSVSLSACCKLESALELALSGGEDYELCFTVPADREAGLIALAANWDCALTCVGIVSSEPGVRFSRGGAAYTLDVTEFEHFT